MSAQKFHLEVLSPTRKLVEAEVTEVLLPSHDGEVGVLAHHEDFLGLLGTGALKYVVDGDDYWFMVSSGMWQVSQGRLTVLAEMAEQPGEQSADSVRAKLVGLEQRLYRQSAYTPEHSKLDLEYRQLKASLEVHRRTNEMQ